MNQPYKYAELVKQIVDDMPPLTIEQRAQLAILLRGATTEPKDAAHVAAA